MLGGYRQRVGVVLTGRGDATRRHIRTTHVQSLVLLPGDIMPAHKSQHYVPQFLLRHFAPDESRRRLNLLRINERLCTFGASLRSQCAENYFYMVGPAFEIATKRGIEDPASTVITAMLREKVVPPPDTEAINDFHRFVVFQWARTPAAVDAVTRELAGYAKAVLRTHPSMRAQDLRMLDAMTIIPPDPLGESLRRAGLAKPLLADLRLKIVVNDSDIEFVMSDAPAVLHNTWSPALGFGSHGIMLVMPLDPRTLSILYDSDVYAVGDDNGDIATTSSAEDIDGLNALQVASARACLYFKNRAMAERLLDMPIDRLRSRSPGGEISGWQESERNFVAVTHQPLSIRLPRGIIQVRGDAEFVPRQARLQPRPEAEVVLELLKAQMRQEEEAKARANERGDRRRRGKSQRR